MFVCSHDPVQRPKCKPWGGREGAEATPQGLWEKSQAWYSVRTIHSFTHSRTHMLILSFDPATKVIYASVYTYVYGSTVSNSPKVETIQVVYQRMSG